MFLKVPQAFNVLNLPQIQSPLSTVLSELKTSIKVFTKSDIMTHAFFCTLIHGLYVLYSPLLRSDQQVLMWYLVEFGSKELVTEESVGCCGEINPAANTSSG